MVEPTEMTTEKERTLERPTRATYNINIHVDNLTEEAMREVQNRIDYLSDVKRWDNPGVAELTDRLMKVYGVTRTSRKIIVEGFWPTLRYRVFDHASTEDGEVELAVIEFMHEQIPKTK